jgi:hypothetical protein
MPPLVQTASRAERAVRAEVLRRALAWKRRVLVDEEGDNSVLQRYGWGEDLTVVIDADGRMVWRADFPAADGLEPFLRNLLGEPLPAQ